MRRTLFAVWILALVVALTASVAVAVDGPGTPSETELILAANRKVADLDKPLVVHGTLRAPVSCEASPSVETTCDPEPVDVAGREVVIESSGDGVEWSTFATVVTNEDGGFAVKDFPTALTCYRAYFMGDDEYASAMTDVVIVDVRAGKK
ncbi:MAG: hypothetical protein IBX62_01100 [Coriobacteriia bacterium]|nr:hypothetical protein [Coriobacteriia bacterium]